SPRTQEQLARVVCNTPACRSYRAGRGIEVRPDQIDIRFRPARLGAPLNAAATPLPSAANVRELCGLSPTSDAPAAAPPAQPLLPHLVMPAHHDVRESDVNIGRLHATLAAAADAGPKDFAELLLTPRVGARTVRSLAMVAEIVHGAPYRFADPARFSMAH